MRRPLRLGAAGPQDGPARARHGEGLRDRVPDAPAPARDHGDLPGQVDLHAASRNVATSSAVPRLVALASGTIRRSKPASTFPAPPSITPAPPPAPPPACRIHTTH